MIEYEKYQELQSKSQKMQEDYERQLAEMEASKEQALEELTEYYETKLQEKTTLLDQVIKRWFELQSNENVLQIVIQRSCMTIQRVACRSSGKD